MRNATLAELAKDYWDAFLATYPSTATVVGDHRFDGRIEDLSEEGEGCLATQWIGLHERLTAIDPASLAGADWVTHGLLEEELRIRCSLLDTRWVEQAWDHSFGVHAEMLCLAQQFQAPTQDSALALVERCRQLHVQLEQATTRFGQAVIRGVLPPRAVITRSLSVLDRYLAMPLEQDPYVTITGPVAWAKEAAWRCALREIARDSIRPAFERYRKMLANDLLPIARTDERVGLCWVKGGDSHYRELMRWHTSLEIEPEELHAQGLRQIRESLAPEYWRLGTRLFGITDRQFLFDRLREDPALRYRESNELLEDSRRHLITANASMFDWFNRMPQTECALRAVPDFLMDDYSVAMYSPPPFDGSKGATCFVNTSRPTDRHRYATAAITFHETIPGHHLQLGLASELVDLPMFQRFSPSYTAYTEGWALYAERLADEIGLYSGQLDRLGRLVGESLRSCRLVVDTGLHALGWSRQQAITFMTANTPMTAREIAIEVDRYIGMPAQALAYKVGEGEILRLRNEAMDRLGDRFDIKAFHDTVLDSGVVTLPILARRVDDWVSTYY